MQISTQNNIAILTQKSELLTDFLSQLQQQWPSLNSQHLVLVLLAKQDIEGAALSLIEELSAAHKELRRSFVVVTDALDYDSAPEHVEVVPTLQEALDVIEMEEIERDLGI